LGRITFAGRHSDFRGGISGPTSVTLGPDGAMWFTNTGTNAIGRIGADGAVRHFTAPGILRGR
jgi:virginiamycin B lyase